MSQLGQIKSHLNIYGRITTWEAIQQYHCTRLSEYIRILREEMEIQSNWKEHNGKRFVEYQLIKDKQLSLF